MSVSFTSKAPNFTAAEIAASNLLDKFGVVSPPVPIYKFAEELGLEVFEASFSGDMNDRVSGFINLESRNITLNKTESPERQRFTLAHEIGHYLLHRKHLEENKDRRVIPRLSPQEMERNDDWMEKEANCFAANLLLPRHMFVNFIQYPDATIGKIFAVSAEFVKYRRLNLS